MNAREAALAATRDGDEASRLVSVARFPPYLKDKTSSSRHLFSREELPIWIHQRYLRNPALFLKHGGFSRDGLINDRLWWELLALGFPVCLSSRMPGEFPCMPVSMLRLCASCGGMTHVGVVGATFHGARNVCPLHRVYCTCWLPSKKGLAVWGEGCMV